VTLTTGAVVTGLRTPMRSVRTIALPAGIAYDAKSFGASLSARILDNDNASRRGDVIRLGAGASRRAFTTSFWIERQRQAPTLDLIFGQEPGLALALQRLGISVHSPEDVARVLRENAALVNLGYIEGVTVNLTPLRWQAGFAAGWMGKGEGRDQLRFRAIASRDENVGATRTNALATLGYSRRVLRQTEIFGSLSWWRGGVRLFEQNGKSIEAGVRQRFDGVPALLQRSVAIEGVAFLDPEMRGAAAGAAPVPDVIVVLDGTRSTRTDAKCSRSRPTTPPFMRRPCRDFAVSWRAALALAATTATIFCRNRGASCSKSAAMFAKSGRGLPARSRISRGKRSTVVCATAEVIRRPRRKAAMNAISLSRSRSATRSERLTTAPASCAS